LPLIFVGETVDTGRHMASHVVCLFFMKNTDGEVTKGILYGESVPPCGSISVHDHSPLTTHPPSFIIFSIWQNGYDRDRQGDFVHQRAAVGVSAAATKRICIPCELPAEIRVSKAVPPRYGAEERAQFIAPIRVVPRKFSLSSRVDGRLFIYPFTQHYKRRRFAHV